MNLNNHLSIKIMKDFSIQEILHQFSFTKSESAIYIAILKLGKAGVSDIAKKAGVNRTAAYGSIKNLIDRGVITQTKIDNVMHFLAVPPSELAEKFQDLTDSFKTAVPHLETLNRIEGETPIVEVTESQSGYFKVYESITNLPAGATFRVIEGRASYIDELSLLSDDQLNFFFGKMVEKKIETKAIFTEESLSVPSYELSPENLRLDKSRIWHIRSLPQSILPLQNLALIYGNRVSFLFPEVSLVLTIRHHGLVLVIEAMFDALFNFGKKVEKK